jgi:hypothetical protein
MTPTLTSMRLGCHLTITCMPHTLKAPAAASGVVTSAPVKDSMPWASTMACRPCRTSAKLAKASQLSRRTSKDLLCVTKPVSAGAAPWLMASAVHSAAVG